VAVEGKNSTTNRMVPRVRKIDQSQITMCHVDFGEPAWSKLIVAKI